MKIGLINSLKEMQAIKNEWQELFLQTGSSNPFLSWEWNYLWISEFCDEEEREILAVRKSEKLIAVLPLKIRTLLCFSCLIIFLQIIWIYLLWIKTKFFLALLTS